MYCTFDALKYDENKHNREIMTLSQFLLINITTSVDVVKNENKKYTYNDKL